MDVLDVMRGVAVLGIVLAVAARTAGVVLSRVWLAFAAFGPVEWVWRLFTYRRRFPLFVPSKN
jgi:uncharacterized membrane protein YeiB